jgi:AcrR family transcriptional regulator
MGSSERKERQRATLQQQILNAAREITIRDGFAALTMRKIADAIEYAPGTIYLYFENRDQIAIQLCRQGYQELLECLQPTATIADSRDRLRAIASSYIDFGLTNTATYRLIFMEDPKFTNAALAEVPIDSSDGAGMQSFQLLVTIFDDMKAERRLSIDADSARLAEIFWTSLHGILSLKLTFPGFLTTPSEELITTMTDTFLAGISSALKQRNSRSS